MAKKTITLYLAKPDINDFDDLLTEGGIDKLAQQTSRVIEPEDFADRARLYIFVGANSEPKFIRDLRTEFDIGGLIKTKAACGLLMFEVDDRLFIATFAHGWMYLNDVNIEGDFGLRVALNALNEKKLKRLERANLGDALRAVSLSPFQRDFDSFGIDDVLDLVRKISGSTKDDASADAVTGSKSLKATGEYEISNLPEIASEALQYYNSQSYQRTSFRILDSVTPITDQRLILKLDELAVLSIRQGNHDFELGLPSTSEVEGVAYQFSGPGLRGRYPDLLLEHYVASLGDKLVNIDVQSMRSHRIIAVHDDDSVPDQKWSIRTALVGSIVHEGGRFATNEGEWYRVDQQFKDSIENRFQELIQPWENPWRPLVKQYDDHGNGQFQSEASYNAEIAEEYGLILLDQRLVQIPGVQRSGFEACDLLDIQGRKLIHVKKNSRRSSVLSHFFKQGSNSAQQLKKFPGAVDNLRDLVADLVGSRAANRLRRELNSTEHKWTVEYVLADTPRQDGNFNIPFFSKITLRDECTNLAAMNYDIVLKFIRLEPENI